ncbi:hypothetical protein KAR91_42295 [Candidatus Pacearchaeota archaeon]|nr:hypothetical protein [Candidatus Pacearchaeota archaeon]
MFEKLLNTWAFQALCFFTIIMEACWVVCSIAKPYEEARGCVLISILLGCAWYCGYMSGYMKGLDK